MFIAGIQQLHSDFYYKFLSIHIYAADVVDTDKAEEHWSVPLIPRIQ